MRLRFCGETVIAYCGCRAAWEPCGRFLLGTFLFSLVKKKSTVLYAAGIEKKVSVKK
jgi:hypothetical protein